MAHAWASSRLKGPVRPQRASRPAASAQRPARPSSSARGMTIPRRPPARTRGRARPGGRPRDRACRRPPRVLRAAIPSSGRAAIRRSRYQRASAQRPALVQSSTECAWKSRTSSRFPSRSACRNRRRPCRICPDSDHARARRAYRNQSSGRAAIRRSRCQIAAKALPFCSASRTIGSCQAGSVVGPHRRRDRAGRVARAARARPGCRAARSCGRIPCGGPCGPRYGVSGRPGSRRKAAAERARFENCRQCRYPRPSCHPA